MATPIRRFLRRFWEGFWGRVLRRAPSEKGADYGFSTMGFTVKDGSEKGSQKGF